MMLKVFQIGALAVAAYAAPLLEKAAPVVADAAPLLAKAAPVVANGAPVVAASAPLLAKAAPVVANSLLLPSVNELVRISRQDVLAAPKPRAIPDKKLTQTTMAGFVTGFQSAAANLNTAVTIQLIPNFPVVPVSASFGCLDINGQSVDTHANAAAIVPFDLSAYLFTIGAGNTMAGLSSQITAIANSYTSVGVQSRPTDVAQMALPPFTPSDIASIAYGTAAVTAITKVLPIQAVTDLSAELEQFKAAAPGWCAAGDVLDLQLAIMRLNLNANIVNAFLTWINNGLRNILLGLPNPANITIDLPPPVLPTPRPNGAASTIAGALSLGVAAVTSYLFV